MNKFELTEKKKNDIFEDFIFPNIIDGLKKLKKPQAYILGGQPGAGKSYFIKKILEENKNIAVINGDDFRGYHPGYSFFLKNNEENAADLTQSDVNYWIEKAILRAIDEKYSIVVEGTMKNADVPIKTASLLKQADYSVELDIVTINPEISKIDMKKRFLMQKKLDGAARFTKIQAHDNVVAKIFENILKVMNVKDFDRVRLYRREVFNYILYYERDRMDRYCEKELENILKKEQENIKTANELKYLCDSKKLIERLEREIGG